MVRTQSTHEGFVVNHMHMNILTEGLVYLGCSVAIFRVGIDKVCLVGVSFSTLCKSRDAISGHNIYNFL